MDFLKTYLAALGGTATVLLIAGTLGKTIVEHWFKKIYKEWELSLEQKYKEDFKRFDSKLDGIQAKESTRYDIGFAKRTDAIRILNNRMQSIKRRLNDYSSVRIESRDMLEYIQQAEESQTKLLHRIDEYEVYFSALSYLFSKPIRARLQNVSVVARRIENMLESEKPVGEIELAMTKFYDDIDALGETFSSLVDSHLLER